MSRWCSTLVAAATTLLVAGAARAGGLEYPDNGAEGLARGAAFTAKADDGTALIYNVAGFARQRGTRLTLGANVAFHEATFQRAGTYPDDPADPLTPWGGERFPLVKSTGSPLPIPHLVLSTDLGTERLTLAAGIYAPSVLGGRVFPLGVEGKPSPARYDAVASGGLIAYPSIAAAYRLTDWLDVGAAANLVVARLEATSISSADLATAICPNQEYQPCDSRQTVSTKGDAATFTIGALLRPAPWLAMGVQFRSAYTLETEGTVIARAPNVQPADIPPGRAFLTQPFPWILRGGVRYVAMEGEREAWDAEVDVTYEAWGSALSEGTQVYIPKLSLFEDIRSTIRLGFRDTMSVRVGGAYNVPFAGGVLSLRAGAYHDTSATKPEDTRLMFDTLAKSALTAGIGLKNGPFALNLAIAKVFHETREVTRGSVRPINGSKGGQSVNGDDVPYDPVNEGVYAASTFAVAFGVTVQLDELFGGKKRDAHEAPIIEAPQERKEHPREEEQREERDEADDDDEEEEEEAKSAPPSRRKSAEDEADRLLEKVTSEEPSEPRRGLDRSKPTRRPSTVMRSPKRRPRASAQRFVRW